MPGDVLVFELDGESVILSSVNSDFSVSSSRQFRVIGLTMPNSLTALSFVRTIVMDAVRSQTRRIA